MNTIQTILHPTDFSESADHAFRLACSLARDHEARLVLLHVVPVAAPVASGMLVGAFSTEWVDDEEPRLTERMEAMRENHPDIPIEWRIAKGNVIDGILGAADDVEAGLIVMGTHGRTGITRFLLGSVAEKVVRHAPCSVLVARPHGDPPPFRHILVPVDFSEYSKRAVEEAGDLAGRTGAMLTLMHVIELPPIS